MIDDGQADVQPGSVMSLPIEEFDPRGPHCTDGPGPHPKGEPSPARMHDSMFDLPIMTAGKVRDRVAGLILDIEALKVVDGDSNWLKGSAQLAREILFYVDEHAAAAAAADEALAAEIKATRG